MKKLTAILLFAALLTALFAGCGNGADTPPAAQTPADNGGAAETPAEPAISDEELAGAVEISLSDETVLVNGEPAGDTGAVYTAHDIVYYEAGRDFTYGEGGPEDEHSAEEAGAHTVVHISAPGVYRVSGTLSAGQLAIDLGEEAEDDPAAVVTLVLDGVDISCSVAPAVIFYNVYECGDKDSPAADVDTSAAGAQVVLADGSVNNINGAYVARIYKSVTLNEDGTEVVDSKKLHKYDAAFYSRMSMEVSGGGALNITAANEGLDSELHLTLNGGSISIRSGNDGINTNEDGVSVTTINAGTLNIIVTGETGEGDGIDSNGWLVINGGTVFAEACATSGDAGIDSDMGIQINGGTVIATGSMLDRIEDAGVNCAVFSFNTRQAGGEEYRLTDAEGRDIIGFSPVNAFSTLVIASPELAAGDYSFYCGDTQLMVSAGMGMGGGMMPGMGMMPGTGEGEMPEMPDVGEIPEMPDMGEMPEMPEGGFDGMTPPEGMDPENLPDMGEMPDWENLPDMGEMPEMDELPGRGERPGGGMGGAVMVPTGEAGGVFTIADGVNYFSVYLPA